MPGRSGQASALVAALLLVFIACPAVAGSWDTTVTAELRYFPQRPLNDDQLDHWNASLSVQPEYVHEWDGGNQQFAFVPFIRLDQHDANRTHFDIRELAWIKAAEDWELRVGLRKVFWGVSEFLHLVDIINQTDLVESTDEEEKLGQPMINLALIRDWGTFDFFLLPGFRERTFADREGRPRTEPAVDIDDARYQSAAEDKHVDFALRWSHIVGNWDVALSHFHGTSREPRLQLRIDDSGRPDLIPFYDIIDQTSLELQYTGEEWLWKFEGLTRNGQDDRFSAFTGGFEYTFVGVFDSAADLGVIAEYAYDDRKEKAPTPFQNDVVFGLRYTLNDEQSTEFLAGAVFDLGGSNARFYSIEASRRLGDDVKFSLEGRFNAGIPSDDIAFPARNDDFLQLELSYFF